MKLLRAVAALVFAAVSIVQAEVVIAEFVAENDGHLLDVDGDSSDWVELHNNGLSPVNLAGWFLTDDVQQPFLWPLPEMTLSAGERRVIFASGKDRRNPTVELHTNFSIANSAGGFLALRKPDGSFSTVFNGYPAQRGDISFGEGTVVDGGDLVAATSSAKFFVPLNGALGTSWTAPGFSDGAWTTATARIGYQANGSGTGLPIAYWTFDDTDLNEIPGGVAVERTGASFNPSVAGAIGEGKSLGFVRSSSQYATAEIDVAETGYSASFWFRTTQANTGLYSVADGALGAGGHDRHVYLTGGNIAVRTWNTEIIASTGKNYADNQWHHVVHVLGTAVGGQKIYVDGIQVAAGTKSVSDFTWQKRIHLGFSNDAGANQYHEGQIDDLSIWNEALNPVAIAILASGSRPDTLAGFSPYISTNVESAMRTVNASAYLRIPFTVSRTTPYNSATLKVRYDDGFVAYIDGVEVARRNAPPSPAWNSAATTDRVSGESVVLESIDISAHAALLGNGNHVLAIHALNDSAASPEFLFNAELFAATLMQSSGIYMDPPTPGAANTTGFLGFVGDTNFVPRRGLYATSQNVTLSSITPGATIAYTLDGTDPSPTNGTLIPAANELTPPSAVIPVSTTRYIRAMAFKPGSGLRSTNVDSHTYILIPQILTQSNSPAGYPASWLGRTADYGMDANVVNTTLPGYSVTEGLMSLPTISITSPVASLFGASIPYGIYYDTSQRGMAGERKVSMEWINPDGSPGWHAQAGIRPHGNSSRGHGFTPKHPLRLSFRGEYGYPRLKENVFGGGVQSFDQLLLRACSTDSMPVVDGNVEDGEQRWNNDKATYMRDQYIRDLLNELGHPNCRGVYAHLFLNGLYWGLYNLAERPNAAWFASTFGGEEEEWDVLKDFQELNDGNATAWNEMTAIVNDTALSHEARCQKLIGNNPDGTRNPAYPIYIHWPSFRDYMIVHIAAGAEDWPDHNYWVGRRRGPLSEGFRFVAWDQEISNDSLTRPSGRGSALPFASIGDTGDAAFAFGPAKIYDKFRRAETFKALFRERIHELLFNNGPLSPLGQKARWALLQSVIDKAIVCESARWGDAAGEGIKKRETTWLNNMNYMNAAGTGYWDAIHPIDVARFRSVQLYPSIDQPVFSQNGGTVPAGFQLFVAHAEPTIYYTLDGGDPMGPSGAPSAGAQLYNGGLATEQPIPPNSTWKYLVTGSQPASSWKNLSFNDTSWASGVGQLGYGDGDEGTVIGFGGNTANRFITTYFRKAFTITNKASIQTAKVFVLRDDGAVIYLNGTELARTNMHPTNAISWSSLATSNVSGTDETSLYYEFAIPVASLLEGTNVLAVEIHKVSASEDDLSFDARVEVVKSNAASGIVLNNSGLVRTRARTSALEWSGVNSAYFTVGSQPPSVSNVVISEIHYNPAPPTRTAETVVSTNPDAFEFIELTNVGTTSVDFTGARFIEGVLFDFPSGYTVAPGGRCVIVRNVQAFEARYGTGRAIAGIFGVSEGTQTGLSNGGEVLTFAVTANNITTPLISFTYDDIAPWPVAPDGNGPSLVLKNPVSNVNHSDPVNWTASADIGGSPAQSASQMTFGQWRKAYSDSLGAGGDDDGDGIQNALEYALGLNPLIRNTGVLPGGQFVTDGGQTYLSITLRHRPAADLSTIVEVSENLSSWSGQPSVVLMGNVDHGDGSFTQTWRSATPHNAPGAAKQFLRIHVTVAP